MRHEYILTDVDGVLLDWDHHFIHWLNNKGIKTPRSEPSSAKLYEWLGLPEDVVCAWIEEFNASSEALNIKSFVDIKHLRALSKKYKVVAITSCGASEQIRQNRLKQLERLNIAFHEVHTLGLMDSKKALLAKYKNSVWVEDNQSNALLGHNLGHTTFLIKRPYNKNFLHDKIRMVNSWLEIKKYLVPA